MLAALFLLASSTATFQPILIFSHYPSGHPATCAEFEGMERCLGGSPGTGRVMHIYNAANECERITCGPHGHIEFHLQDAVKIKGQCSRQELEVVLRKAINHQFEACL